MSKTIIVYRIEEFDSAGLRTVEHFATEAERDERLRERKRYPYGTIRWETDKVRLTKNNFYKLNYHPLGRRENVAVLKDENKLVRDLIVNTIKDVRNIMKKLNIKE